ncbi:FGGY-family carbohydrate kinase [Aureimonas glaciei]|uniref:Xylulokinase n=1 Tax=Aureimonas glaciei TaxID=1776957 RepID=A0A916XTW6_9HYPH|nr:FGGY-family carbohydrate kinase [Aureimonas glaciei]GGD10144.1 xylulokinase [Aureimonas glaciei]
MAESGQDKRGTAGAAAERLVVGIDSSTQSTKAIAFDASGRTVAEGRAPVALSSPKPGHAEQEPEDWWTAACTALKAVTRAVGADRIDAVAISNQRETVAFLGADGRPIGPALVWLDERATPTHAAYAERMGRTFLHETTGKPVDTIPVVYRLDWLRQNDPALLDAAAEIVDAHGFLVRRLTGTAVASWTSADPFGIFDITAMRWSPEILASLAIPLSKLPQAVRPGTAIGQVNAAGAAATGLAEGTPLYAAGGDGQCAGLGANAFRPGQVYLNLGTATITGVYSKEPRTSLSWRTMTGPTGEGYFLESAQKAGAFFVNWVIDTFCGGRADPAVFDALEAAAARLPVGCEGLMMTPHILGVMNPHWDPKARGAIVGLSPGHGRAHLYRAALEALTLEIARALSAMAREGIALDCIRAIGGGAKSRMWLQMLADATGLPVERSATVEASALGAAIIAARGAGWFGSYKEAAEAMTEGCEKVLPRPEMRSVWDALSARQDGVYFATRAYGMP